MFDRDGNLVSQSDGIEYTVSEENLAENLLERLKELYHLRTAYGIDDVTAGAFDAEIQFVLQQAARWVIP